MKRAARPPRGPARQRGATLVVALVFLVLMSLFAVQAFLSSSTELRIVGNMQARQEGIAAAQVAIEQALEGNTFGERWLIADLLDLPLPPDHAPSPPDHRFPSAGAANRPPNDPAVGVRDARHGPCRSAR